MTTKVNGPTHHRTRVNLPEQTRDQVIQLLNASLATALDLRTQVKQAHWNVAGPQFYSLHLFFDKIADDVEEAVDLLAERAVQLGGTALGTARIAAERSILGEYPHDAGDGKEHVEALAERIGIFANHVREAIRTTSGLSDDSTADVYTEISRAADKNLWMLEAHLRT
ncbi:MAG: DNA starvation/stationary phase protection protein Dps [Vulcanimicrobiaceae bacterium]